jgi:hypothetical protein
MTTPCCSGRHHWSDPSDAAKCCDPRYVRSLVTRVHTPGFVAAYGHYWLETGRPQQGEPTCPSPASVAAAGSSC